MLTMTDQMNIPVAAVRRLSDSMRAAKRSALVKVGFYLLAKQKQHFDALTSGQGSNGVQWRRHAPGTAANRRRMAARGQIDAAARTVGIMSGRIRDGFSFATTATGVRLRNTTPWFNMFNEQRPVYPLTIPAPWSIAADRIVTSVISKRTAAAFT